MEQKRKMFIDTLTKGRDSAKKLQNLRRRKVNLDESVSAEDLLMEILGSFSGSLSMLNSCDSDEIFGIPARPVDQVPEVDAGKKPASGVKERRGCYKRRYVQFYKI